MWRESFGSGFVAVALVLVACGGGSSGEAPSPEAVDGAPSPEAAVSQLVDHLNEPDFASASGLAVPNQAALASLAEGATFAEVADALETGDTSVAANFWAGFAQGAGSFLAGEVSVAEGAVVDMGGIEFHQVTVVPEADGARQMLVQDVDGYRVDLFASFAPGLADKMIPPVERLLSSQTRDAFVILSELRSIAPSLELALDQPGLSPRVSQQVLQLLELVTRVE